MTNEATTSSKQAANCQTCSDHIVLPDESARTPRLHPMPGPQRLAFSVKETAAILGVSEKTVRRLIARKLLRASRALRHLLIPAKEIEKFLERTTPS